MNDNHNFFLGFIVGAFMGMGLLLIAQMLMKFAELY